VMHKDTLKIRVLFEARGYREIPRDDSWECNFVLGDSFGHLVDLHSCTFDETGNNIFGVKYPYDSLNGKGSINGFPVRCITPDWMVKFHSGYKLDENDYHDVSLLCRQYSIEMPKEYEAFVLNDKRV